MHFGRSTRRSFLKISGVSLVGASLTGLTFHTSGTASATSASSIDLESPSVTSSEALQQLLQGNLRFQKGKAIWPNQTLARRKAIAQEQNPFALIFGCVDSRVPPELVFDRGLGDIFDIRTAGHVIDNAALGSLEFGVEEFHCPLLVVLGHERCGAVSATITAIDSHEEPPGSIRTLVDYIRPSVLAAHGTGATRLDNAVRLNVSHTVRALHQSKILNDAVKSGQLTILGAYYDLDTGAVDVIYHD
jgi:carbonic anhydrase